MMSDSALQSNRAPTASPFSTLQLLYYNSYMSSGRLPPQMQTELCQLWCLVEGEADPFEVIANWTEHLSA